MQESRESSNVRFMDDERIDALLQAFESFCQETSRLEASYAILKEELHAANQKLESLFSHLSQGILVIDFEGKVETLNTSAVSLLGKSKKQVEGKLFSSLFDDGLLGFSMKEALSTKKAPLFNRISLKDKEIDVETIFMESALMVTLHDRSELLRLELLASRHDRMKALGEMAAEVAHEIRNPLGGIKGFASLLKRDLKGQPAQAKLVDYIIEGTDNLSQLVNQVLDYARPIKPHFEPLKLTKLLAEGWQMIELNASIQPKPSLEVQVEPEDLQVSLDEAMMKGALLNLFVNSCQAMPQGGVIKIKGRLEKNELILDISDTGIGVPKALQEKIFSPFFTTKTGGTGLGLAEVHKIVQAHGGKIELESEKNKGTLFRIKIPQRI